MAVERRSLDGKVAIVTGAGRYRGIGRHIAPTGARLGGRRGPCPHADVTLHVVVAVVAYRP